MKWSLILFSFFLTIYLIGNILADSPQLIIACAGDSQLIIPCNNGDLENYPYQTEKYTSTSDTTGGGGAGGVKETNYSMICKYLDKYPHNSSFEIASLLSKDSNIFISSSDIDFIKSNYYDMCKQEEIEIMGKQVKKSYLAFFVLAIIIISIFLIQNNQNHKN